MPSEQFKRQTLAFAKAVAEMSVEHWGAFVEDRAAAGATFAEWKPVFLRDLREVWRNEFPKPEHWRAMRKLVIDPMLEHIAREHFEPRTRTVASEHMTVRQAIAVADWKTKNNHPRADEYARMAEVAVHRAGGNLDTPLISVSDGRWDGSER
jgi:hypothetical protein